VREEVDELCFDRIFGPFRRELTTDSGVSEREQGCDNKRTASALNNGGSYRHHHDIKLTRITLKVDFPVPGNLAELRKQVEPRNSYVVEPHSPVVFPSEPHFLA